MSVKAQLSSGPISVRRADWRLVAYWIATILVAYENLDGFIWSVLHIDYITDIATHLGYPLYFINILGAFQLVCAVALLVPRLPIVKEWAYTGAFINYSSALTSHLLVRDPPVIWSSAFIMLVLLGVSWLLRPSHRRADSVEWTIEPRLTRWIAPVVLLAIFTVVGLATLPLTQALPR